MTNSTNISDRIETAMFRTFRDRLEAGATLRYIKHRRSVTGGHFILVELDGLVRLCHLMPQEGREETAVVLSSSRDQNAMVGEMTKRLAAARERTVAA